MALFNPASRLRSIGSAAILTGLTTFSGTALAGPKVEFGEHQWVSIGAGLRAAFTSTGDGAPDGDSRGKDFDVQSIRLYINGQISETIGFTLNTEEIFGDGPVDVLDAIARFEFSPQVNVWVGRMLVPADRIEMNGPYYGLSWNQYTQPLFPSDQGGDAGTYGRDDGITFWGAQGKFQYAIGVFNGVEGFGNVEDELLYAARFAYNFLNMESNPGYYTSSTYYGGLGNIFTLAASYQTQNGGTGTAGETTTPTPAESGDFEGYTIDLLSETVLDNGGVLTIEAEYKDFDADYTVATQPTGVNTSTNPCFCLFDGESSFATAAYLLPKAYGPGKIQPYARLVENKPSDASTSDLNEYGVNYIIKGHNARLNVNYSDGDANISGYKSANDVSSFSLGVQIQL